MLEHERLRGIDHVVRSQPVVQPARRVGLAGGSHLLSDGSSEGNDIVFHFALDFVNARDLESGMLAQRSGGLSVVVGYLALLTIPSAVIFGMCIEETRGLSLEVAAREDA